MAPGKNFIGEDMLRPTTNKKAVPNQNALEDLKLVGKKHKIIHEQGVHGGMAPPNVRDLHQVGFAVSTADVEPTETVRADQPWRNYPVSTGRRNDNGGET